jgi:cytochrome c oxidase subunit I
VKGTMTTAIEQSYLHQPRGLKSWFFTRDHKRIAIMYMIATLTFMAMGITLAFLMRVEQLHPTRDIMGPETYNRIFTLHGAIMIFLFIIPSIPVVLGNFVLPQMIGARDVAFPRLNLASWYIYMGGALFALYSLARGGVDTGWTFYTPYSAQSNTAVIPMTLGVFIIGISSILTGLNFIVTIHKLRIPGMTWFKMPLFIWALYATSIIQVLATPVLGITLVLLILERLLGIGIFDPAMGGDPILYQHFFWFYSHPAVYIIILPGMGIISELISVFSHKKIFGYNAIAFSGLAIAFIGFLVWGHHMFVSGQSVLAATLFSFLTFMVAIPSGIKIFNWLATMYKGQIIMRTPFLFALIFLLLFSIGGLTGMFLGALAVNVHLHDTYFVVAHFHYVIVGGTFMAYLGGLHYWWPKMFGRLYNDKWGIIAASMIFVGFNVLFFSMFVLGSHGMPRRYYTYLPQFQNLQDIATVGSWILISGIITLFANLIHSLFRGRPAPANPWGALTLEWTVPSPTPPENFPETPYLTHGPYDYDKVLVRREIEDISK